MSPHSLPPSWRRPTCRRVHGTFQFRVPKPGNRQSISCLSPSKSEWVRPSQTFEKNYMTYLGKIARLPDRMGGEGRWLVEDRPAGGAEPPGTRGAAARGELRPPRPRPSPGPETRFHSRPPPNSIHHHERPLHHVFASNRHVRYARMLLRPGTADLRCVPVAPTFGRCTLSNRVKPRQTTFPKTLLRIRGNSRHSRQSLFPKSPIENQQSIINL